MKAKIINATRTYNMAMVSYNKAVNIDPKFAFAWDNLGLSYRKIGNYKEAIKCYENRLKLIHQELYPFNNMGVAYTMLEDYTSAAETYDKYIKYTLMTLKAITEPGESLLS